MKRTKTSFSDPMGRIGCVRCEKFRRDFVARSFALVRPNSPEGNQIVRNAAIRQFRVQRGGSGAFFAKIPRRFHGTKFCTCSARFPLSFVRQPNGPEYNQIVLNTVKHQFRVQRDGSGAFVAKKFRREFWARTFCTSSARFAPSFVKQTNNLECTQIVRNAPKHQFRVQWGGSGAFVAKNSYVTSWHELLH